MPEQELWRNRRMGANPMKITVVGVVLIVVAVIAGALLVRTLKNKAVLSDQRNADLNQEPSQGTA